MKRDWTPLESRVREDHRLAVLPDDTCRLFYLMARAQLDSWGRIGSFTTLLSANVWPLLGRSSKETERCLCECIKAGLFELYRKHGVDWIQMPEWSEFHGGKIERRGRPEWPEPTPDCLQDPAGVTPESLRTKSGPSPLARTRVSCPVSVSGSLSGGESARGVDDPPLPKEIDTVDVAAALADYQESRREQGHKPLKPQGLKAMYGKLARWGPEGAVAALRDSIANGYQGVFLPKGWQANGSPQLFASEKSMSNIRNVIAKIQAKETNGKALQPGAHVRALPEPDRERGDLLGLPGRPPRDAG
jgi:hypothetical protein